jgi:hypothetical protein
LEAQPALVEYFVSLIRVRSSISAKYTPALLPAGERPSPPPPSFPRKRESTAPGAPRLQPGLISHIPRKQAQPLGFTMCTMNMPYGRRTDFRKHPSLHSRKTTAKQRLRALPYTDGHLGQSKPVVHPAARDLWIPWPVMFWERWREEGDNASRLAVGEVKR